jgi:hypothetical protein
VAPSDSTTISFTCDALELQTGRTWSWIKIDSNDPDEPEKTITVHFDIIPGTPSNVYTYIESDLLYIGWDIAPGADSYDIFWADDPYGTFTYYGNTPSNLFATSTFWAKKFFYIVAKSDD